MSKTPAWTQGKWEAEYGTGGYYLVTRDGGLELSSDTAANCRLIEAAPELYTMLLVALRYIEDLPTQPSLNFSAVTGQIAAVLANARGGRVS